MGENLILLKDVEEAEKIAKAKQKAINIASAKINDAKARYIKEKTRARSKKAAMEKDAILNSNRFDRLAEYGRFEDIQEAYGYDCITEKERDDLEALWQEREEIKNHTDDGIYKDLVTEALDAAWLSIQDMWSEEIDKATVMRRKFDKEAAEGEAAAKAWMDEQNRAYEKYVKGD